MIESSAEVVGVVGLKDKEFIQEISGPGVEPWFVVNCVFFGEDRARTFFTKDAELYYSPFSEVLLAFPQEWHGACPAVMPHNFLLNEQVLVEEAIERYVTEVAGQNNEKC